MKIKTKSLHVLLLALVVMLAVSFGRLATPVARAAEGDVAEINGTTYATLQEAVEAAEDHSEYNKVVLKSDVVLSETLLVSGKVVLDLNGKKISTDVANWVGGDSLISVKRGADLLVIDEAKGGQIYSGDNEKILGVIKMTVTGENETTPAATLKMQGGTVTGYYYGICGNGYRNNTNITIDGATIIGLNAAAIFNPQDGMVTISGDSVIKGTTGIEMRSGSLTVTGGEIMATAEEFEVNANGSGSTVEGAAIAISQHTTNHTINVNVKGGKLYGLKSVYEVDTVNDGVTDVTIALSGGRFDGEVYSENVTGFISGGEYTVIDPAYIKGSADITIYEAKDNYHDGAYFKTIEEAIAGVPAGETIRLTKNIERDVAIEVNKSVVVDLMGFAVVSTGRAFNVTAGESTFRNGNIVGVTEGFYLDGTANEVVVNLEKGLTVVATENAVYIKGKAKLVTEADLLSTGGVYATIQGSGNDTMGTEIIINDGNVLANGSAAIYHPQVGKITVNDGLIQGASGIIVRNGELVINDGHIIANATTFVPETGNLSGSDVMGAAVAVVDHATDGSVKATINGGTLQGKVSFYEQAGYSVANEIAINGGMFIGEMLAEDASEFFYGGTVQGDIELWYAARGYAMKEIAAGSNIWGVVAAEARMARATNSYKYEGYEFFEQALAAVSNDDILVLNKDVTVEDIVVIDDQITFNGNNYSLTSMATRAINVSVDGMVGIGNLTIINGGNCERAINVIEKKANLLLYSVKAEGFKYTVNVAASAAAGTRIHMNDCEFSGYAALNITGVDRKISIVDSILKSVNDQAVHASNVFGTLVIAGDNIEVNVTGGKIVAEGNTNAQHAVLVNYVETDVTDIAENAKLYLDTELEVGGTVGGQIIKVLGFENNDIEVRDEYASEIMGYGYLTAPGSTGMVKVNGEAVAIITRNGEHTSYATIEEAIAASIDGDEIKVIKNVTTAAAMNVAGKKITINLNDNVFNVKYYKNQIQATADVTFKNGTVDISNVSEAKAYHGIFFVLGNLTFDNVKFVGTNYDSDYAVFYVLGDSTKALSFVDSEIALTNDVCVGGGVFKSENNDSVINITNTDIALKDAKIASVAGNITIDGGKTEIINGANAFNGSTLTIKNAEVTIDGADGRGITANDGDINIIDSKVTITNTVESSIRFKQDKEFNVLGTSELNIETVSIDSFTDVGETQPSDLFNVDATATMTNMVAMADDIAYAKWADALADALDSDSILTLLTDIQHDAKIEVVNDLDVDLNGYTLNSEADVLFYVTGVAAHLYIDSYAWDGNGYIKGYVNVKGDAIYADATVNATYILIEAGEDAIITAGGNAAYLRGDVVLDVYGELRSTSTQYATIQGNGSGLYDGTEIYISSDAKVISENNVAIYNPQNGVVEVYGYVEGTSGIIMRNGELYVYDGAEIVATATTFVPETTNGSGSDVTGAAIAVSDYAGIAGAPNVVINGGKFTGTVAFYEFGGCDVAINGGEFHGTEAALYAENAIKFVNSEDALFYGDVDNKYAKDGYAFRLNNDGAYQIVEAFIVNVNTNVYYDTLAEAIDAAKDGETISIIDDITVNEAFNVVGKNVSVVGASSDVTVSFTAGGNKVAADAGIVFADLIIDISKVDNEAKPFDYAIFFIEGFMSVTDSSIVGDGYNSNYAVFYVLGNVDDSQYLIILDSTIDLTNEKSDIGGVFKSEGAESGVVLVNIIANFVDVDRLSVNVAMDISNSTITVKGGDNAFNGSMLWINDSNVTITEGTGRGITVDNGDIEISNSTVSISKMGEGSIRFKKDHNITVQNASTVNIETIVMDNGTNPNDFIDVLDTSTMTKMVAAIEREDGSLTCYSTFELALASITDKGTIKLLADVIPVEKIVIDADVTIDLAGFDMYVDDLNAGNYAIVVNNKLTITDSTDVAGNVHFVGDFGIGLSTTCTGGLVIENGIFTQDGESYLIGAYAGQVVINGGEFETEYCVVCNFETSTATVEITDGKFVVVNALDDDTAHPLIGENFSVSGGCFSHYVEEEMIKDGYACLETETGCYDVVDIAEFVDLMYAKLVAYAEFLKANDVYDEVGLAAFDTVLAEAKADFDSAVQASEIREMYEYYAKKMTLILNAFDRANAVKQAIIEIKEYAAIKDVEYSEVEADVEELDELAFYAEILDKTIEIMDKIDELAGDADKALNDAKEAAIVELLGDNEVNKLDVTSAMVAAIYSAENIEQVNRALGIAKIELGEIKAYKTMIRNASDSATAMKATLAEIKTVVDGMGAEFDAVVEEIEKAMAAINEVKDQAESIVNSAISADDLADLLDSIEAKIDASATSIIDTLSDTINTKIDALNTAINDGFDAVDGRFDDVDSSIANVTLLITELDSVVDGMVNSMVTDTELAKELDDLAKDVEKAIDEAIDGLSSKLDAIVTEAQKAATKAEAAKAAADAAAAKADAAKVAAESAANISAAAKAEAEAAAAKADAAKAAAEAAAAKADAAKAAAEAAKVAADAA
ncbi:MAG: hypothetical protein IJD07_04245, partial [Clostridia bacterium]|nr:hypothetical protein [Clostridia bacterium]